MEVIGIVVNISTLCEYIYHGIISIRTTIKYIRDLPDVIRDRSQYLASLASIVEQIAHTRTLQTTTIEIHLKLVKDNINSLRDLVLKSQDIKLKKRSTRLWKAYRYGPGLEEKTAKVFTYLERSKSNLQLYIMTQCIKDRKVERLGHECRGQVLRKSPERQQGQDIQATSVAGCEMVPYQDQRRQQEPTYEPTSASVERPSKDDENYISAMYDVEDRRKFGVMKVVGDGDKQIAGDRTEFDEVPRSELVRKQGRRIDAREFGGMHTEGNANTHIAGDWTSAKSLKKSEGCTFL